MGLQPTGAAEWSNWARTIFAILRKRVQRREFEVSLRVILGNLKLTLCYDRFWESVQQMKALPQSGVKEAVNNVWREYLSPDAPCPVNVDSKSVELAREAVQSTTAPNRWCFDVAAAHVYHLMKSDSYSRFLRSDMYKEYLNGSKKKVKSIPNLFGVKR